MRGVRRLGEHWASVAKRSEEQQHQTITGDASTSGWMSTAIYCSVEAWSTSIKNPAWGTDVRDAAELLMEQPREKVRVEHEVGLVRFARWFFFSLLFPVVLLRAVALVKEVCGKCNALALGSVVCDILIEKVYFIV